MGDEAETRKASIYLPAGYASEGERRYPTLYFFDGGDAIENGSVKNVLDNLSGERVQPVDRRLRLHRPRDPGRRAVGTLAVHRDDRDGARPRHRRQVPNS